MIFDAVSAAQIFSDGVFQAGERLSVVRVQTTRPKYLVFAGHDRSPRVVVEFGDITTLRRSAVVMGRLHRECSTLVARPVHVGTWRGAGGVLIQRGLPGVPWFSLSSRCRSVSDWLAATAAATDALRRFDAAIRARPRWTVRIEPGRELRSLFDLVLARGLMVSEVVRSFVLEQVDALSELGAIDSRLQHGDFCFNNLLIDGRNAAVIDFDEFGLTGMPCQDLLGLLESLTNLAPQPARDAARHKILGELEEWVGSVAHGRDYRVSLLTYYTLWRISRSQGVSTRDRALGELSTRLALLADSSGTETFG